MFELSPASAPFAKLAAEIGAVDAFDPLAGIQGTRPDNVDRLFSDASNADLTAGMDPPDIKIEELERAAAFIRPEQCRSREDHRNNALLPLVAAAVQSPEDAECLRSIMHQVSDQPGAFVGEYPREANDQEWDDAYRDTERRLARGASIRTIGSFFHAAEINGFVRSTPTVVALQVPLPDASEHCLTAQLRRPNYKRRLMHGSDLQRGEVSIYNGTGGSGKSTFAAAQAVSLASGQPLLGQAVHRPQIVLIINQEEDVGEVTLKLHAVLSHYGSRIPADTSDRIIVYGAGQAPGLRFIHSEGRQERLNLVAFQLLDQIIADARADVVYLDPWSVIAGGALNDNALMYAAIQGLKHIAAARGCAIVIVAHTKKGGTIENDGQEATLGAVAITNAARIVKGVRRLDAAECKALGVPYGREGHIRQIVDQKSNYTPLGDGQYIEILGVRIKDAEPPDYPEDDYVGVAVQFVPQPGGRILPAAGLKDVLIRLARGVNGGVDPYSTAKQVPRGQSGATGAPAASRYFGPDVAAVLAAHIPGAKTQHLDKAAKEALDDAIGRGWAEVDDFKVGGNSRKGIRVVWSATPWAADPKPQGAYVR